MNEEHPKPYLKVSETNVCKYGLCWQTVCLIVASRTWTAMF